MTLLSEKNINLQHFIRAWVEDLSDTIINSILNEKNSALGSNERQYFKESVDNNLKVKRFFIENFCLCDSLISHNAEIEELTITVAIFENCEELSVSATNFPIDGSYFGMHLDVFVSNDLKQCTFHDSDFWFLFKEIENSIRHELEHLIQDDFSELTDRLNYHKINFRHPKNGASNLCLYLVQPSEVAAHVRGYEQVSDSHFLFYKNVIDLLNAYLDKRMITSDEHTRIFLCWKDWFQRNTYILKEK